MAKLLHPKATAVWLVDNTTLSFKQIADFTGMHELEIQGIADGDVAAGVKGFDPITNNQLVQDEIDRAEADPLYKMRLKHNPAAVDEEKRRGPRSTPLSKRQDRPASILWLVFPVQNPELVERPGISTARRRLVPCDCGGDIRRNCAAGPAPNSSSSERSPRSAWNCGSHPRKTAT